MDSIIRRKLSMARRAVDFAKTQTVADPGYTTVVNRLQAAVDQGDALIQQQHGGQVDETVAVGRRGALRAQIRRQQLTRLATIARIAARTHPELVGQFPLPTLKGPNRVFLMEAEAMLAAALPDKDLFVSLGLGDNFFDEVTASLAELSSMTESAHSGRSDHVVAGAELKKIAQECRTDVKVLDTFIRAAFQASPEIIAGWVSASNLPGPFQHTAPEPAPVVPPVPVAAGGAN